MVSIIIPAYNVEKYISRGIESCIAQTYKDIEVIVIDDGSTDGTFRIVSGYIARDHRIRGYTQKNKGVSVARNKGLEEAKGNYILFLDADDWLETTTVEELIQNHKDGYLISVSYKLVCINEDGTFTTIRPHNEFKDAFIKKDDLIECFCRAQYRLTSSCYKLYVRKIIDVNDIKFESGIHNGEDGLFVFRYLLCVDGLIYQNKPYWNILQRPDSATNKGYNKKMITAIDAATMIVNYTDHDPVNARYGKYYFTCRSFMVKQMAAYDSEARLSLEEKRKIDISVKRYVKNYVQVEKSVSKKLKALIYIYSPLFVLRGLLVIYYKIFYHRKNNL